MIDFTKKLRDMQEEKGLTTHSADTNELIGFVPTGETIIPNEPEQAPYIGSYYALGNADHRVFCEARLREQGLDTDWKVEVADDHSIQLDYDVPYEGEMPAQFEPALAIFQRRLIDGMTASYRKLRSKGGRTHVIIRLSKPMPLFERIAWQAAFGSDFKREALSLAYAAHGQIAPVLLYSRKVEAAIIVPIPPKP